MKLPETTLITSGEFFGNQGAYLEQASRGQVIMIKRYGREHVVMMSPEQFKAFLTVLDTDSSAEEPSPAA